MTEPTPQPFMPPLALAFDDALLVPRYSEVLPPQAAVETHLTSQTPLRIPLLSAAMDTVTEGPMGIAMAQQGGLGIIHKNLTAAEQAREVLKVKKSESGMIVDPVTISPQATLGDARALMRRHNISGIPVVDGRVLAGIITHRDLRFQEEEEAPLPSVMTREVVTAAEGTTLAQAKVLLSHHRIEKLPVVDARGELVGLITIKDIEKNEQHPHATKDELGRLRVGAAIGVGPDRDQRLDALVEAGVDLVAIDTAHGHSKGVLDAVIAAKRRHPSLPIIAGNVATAEGTAALADAGADGIKIGIGPGSICTTRVVAGVGVPQLSAIFECAPVARSRGVTLIADGGIRHSGDIVKALAAGADSVMVGSLLAGTDEAPGEVILNQGRSYKAYRGMGSLAAMVAGSADRYFQRVGTDAGKLVPEGVEGMVPYRGPVERTIHLLVGGVRSGMGYCGVANLEELRREAQFIRISPAGFRESHVHDVTVTQEPPNYRT